ncbi:MAG: 4Fe-4S binding protein [Sedimentibacter sp.]|uniref:4Fe-4S binding protein n=1 Tax=Sedimentibacter sp. TaxID=1960295 RepID=UPI00315963CE
MEKRDLIRIAEEFVVNSKENYITEEMAISEKVAGMKIFDAPIFAFCSADDECFALLKQPSAIGEHFMLPREWMPPSKTVISFFLPFSEEVRKGNRKDMSWPSEEWLHGRIEGQILVNKLCMHLRSELESAGYESIVPSLDERFWSNTNGTNHETMFTSNWSERHAAFVCGLGTFGLSKGLITPKGMAGRFGSIITGLHLSPDRRDYENVYEYCSMCGKCVKNCPINAITMENGKDHFICSEFLNKTREKHSPRYGCGKCQVDVPCECRIPVLHGKDYRLIMSNGKAICYVKPRGLL